MVRQIGLIGVPSSADAHWPGQEKAPQALRAAGLLEQLRLAGCSVFLVQRWRCLDMQTFEYA